MQVLGAAQVHQHHPGLQSLLALANEAAELGPDMREPELEHDLDSARQLTGAGGRATSNKTQPQSPTPEFSGLDRAAQKDAAVLSRAQLVQKYGYAIADRAIASAPTAQQAFAEHRREVNAANAKLGKALKAAGVKPMQHSVKDFVHVLCTQLELQLNGENPTANEVLNLAFPDDPTKAKRIGESKRVQRVQEAYDSPEVMNHTVEKGMLDHHGKRCMNLRTQTQQFSHSLATGVVLFECYKQGAEIDQLKARVQLLEQKVECINNREALADAGAKTPEDRVLALYAQGKRQTEIAKLLEMPVNSVKSILRRSKNS